MMSSWMKRLAGTALVLALAGCAHPISLSVDAVSLPQQNLPRIERKVGLQISDADLAREVTSAGGGGDKLSYRPYRDLETPLYVALGQVFSGVRKVSGPNDPKIAADGLSFVIAPVISTQSYSDSIVTWPPTQFSVELVCKVTDAKGQPVTEVRATGDGRAVFDEFKSNTGLSAQRAVSEALQKLVKALANDPALRR